MSSENEPEEHVIPPEVVIDIPKNVYIAAPRMRHGQADWLSQKLATLDICVMSSWHCQGANIHHLSDADFGERCMMEIEAADAIVILAFDNEEKSDGRGFEAAYAVSLDKDVIIVGKGRFTFREYLEEKYYATCYDLEQEFVTDVAKARKQAKAAEGERA